MTFLNILTGFQGGSVSVSVRKMSSTRALCILWVTWSLLLLRCPGLTLLLLEAEEVALVEVYLQQPSHHVGALLHGQVVDSSRDSAGIEHQDCDRETLEAELVLVGLSHVEFALLLLMHANKTLNVCEIEAFVEKEDIKNTNTQKIEISPFIIYLLCYMVVTLVSFIEEKLCANFHFE